MKNKLTLLSGLAIALLFSSCSIMQNEFSKQRYTHFKTEHNSTVSQNTGLVKELPVSVSSLANTAQTSVMPVNNKVTITPAPFTLNEKSSVNSITHELPFHGTMEIKRPGQIMKNITAFKEADHHKGGEVNGLVLVILCILLPPLAVYLAKGVGTPFWVDLILTLFFWIPGIIYALIVCL